MNAAASWMLITGKVLIYLAIIAAIMFVAVYALAKSLERLLSLADPWDDDTDESSQSLSFVPFPTSLPPLCGRRVLTSPTTHGMCLLALGHGGNCSPVSKFADTRRGVN